MNQHRAFILNRSGRLLSVAAAAVAFGGFGAVPSSAQQAFGLPWIPPELLDETRSLDDDRLSFCLNTHSVLVEFDRAVAQAIADTLLLDAEFFEMVYPTAPYKYDYRVPLTESQLFVSITNHCDAFMGFRLTPDTPDWLTVSRPYLESQMVFMSTNTDVRSFDDIAATGEIGVRMAGTGHRELRTYLQALPEAERPSQIPYPNNEVLIERLHDGTIGTVLIWEYAPYFARGDDAAPTIESRFPAPFPIPPLQFAAAILQKDTFVRGLIDRAIEELLANGELERLKSELLAPAVEHG